MTEGGEGLSSEQKRVIANLEVAEGRGIVSPAEASKGIRAVKAGAQIGREDLRVESTAPDVEDMLKSVQEAAKIKAVAEREVAKGNRLSKVAGKK